MTRAEALVWMLRNQLGRRNLCDLDRVALALTLKPLLAEQARQRQREAGEHYGRGQEGKVQVILPEAFHGRQARDDIAGLSGVSARTVDKVETILAHAAPPLVHAVRTQHASISAAADIATLPAEEQAEIVARCPLARGD